MFSRRQLLIAGAAGTTLSLSGCITPMLFEPKTYKEKVSSIMVSNDNKKLVIFTKEFHYIFDLPPELATVLQGSLHQYVKADIYQFHVDADGKINGGFRLRLDLEAPEEEKQKAGALGFSSQTGLLDGTLSGVRYAANGVHPPSNLRLNQEYEVTIRAEQSAGSKAAKALLTPVTVTADGVLVIAAVPLGILMFTVFLFICGSHKDGCK